MRTITKGVLIIALSCIAAFFWVYEQATADDQIANANPTFMMNEVVVTADREDEAVVHIPAQITVITQDDIQKSTSKNVSDLLSSEGGLVKRGFLGNDKKAAIDIRGMGETSVSSVLVLVDGVRINPLDMAGPDLSTISLGQIERIEIVRGAGTVLYGNGAVGGIVNIITRRPGGRPIVNTRVQSGSYDAHQATASAGGTIGRIHLQALGDIASTDGYRQNGHFDNRHVDLKAAWDLNDWLAMNGKLQVHLDEYGFPGPLTYTQFQQDPRQSRDQTGSSGETRSDTITAGMDADFGQWGHLSAVITHYGRENRWTLLKTPGEIDECSQELNLKHKWAMPFDSHLNELKVGFDYRVTDYQQVTSFAKKPYQQDSYGLYLFNKLTLSEKWILQTGYRYHSYDTKTDNTGEKKSFDSADGTAGVIYLFLLRNNITGSIFANYAESFRIPDVDEFGFSTADIQPQSGIHWDAGIKLLFKDRAELSLTGFDIRIEDEIWFDAMNYINTNYDRSTIRQGVEVSFRIFPQPQFRLWGQYSYTKATFEGRNHDKLPTVPDHKLSAGFTWTFQSWLEWAVSYNYVGDRPQGGDPLTGSNYAPMPSYQTSSTKLTANITPYHLKLYVAVNNLFDESYYTLAYYNNVYPAPGRNYRIGVELKY